MKPYEIIGAPLTLWLAPTGTAFPKIDEDPAAEWIMVGTSGDDNYSEEGVAVSHSQTVNKVRPAGSTGARKAFRDAEDMMIRVTLWDMTLEQYATALNNNALTTTAAAAGEAGFKKVGLSRGKSVTEYALLARGVSPYDEAMAAQYEVPRCYEGGSPEVQYRKGIPAGLAMSFEALEDIDAASDDERFGRIIAQHQAQLP